MTLHCNQIRININNKNIFNVYYANLKIGNITKNNNEFILNIFNDENLKYEHLIKSLLANYYLKENDKIIINNKVLNKDEFFYLNSYENIMLDIDDTILCFYKSEKKALTLALKKVNYIASEKDLALYHKINISYWEKVERKEITREECLVYRFKEFLPLININYDPSKFEDIYRYYLNKQVYLIQDAKLVLNILKEKFNLYAITNGVYKTQMTRMNKAKIINYFKDIFISDALGHHKPSIEYFNLATSKIKNFNKDKTIIIGDSLTSDIMLGINNNVATIHFDFKNINYDKIVPNYKITTLKELLLHYLN